MFIPAGQFWVGHGGQLVGHRGRANNQRRLGCDFSDDAEMVKLRHEPGPPMDLANMRRQVSSLRSAT
jgi:hypothetical protein